MGCSGGALARARLLCVRLSCALHGFSCPHHSSSEMLVDVSLLPSVASVSHWHARRAAGARRCPGAERGWPPAHSPRAWGRPAGDRAGHAGVFGRGPGQPGQRSRAQGRARRAAGGEYGRAGVRQGPHPHGRRAQERRHQRGEPQARAPLGPLPRLRRQRDVAGLSARARRRAQLGTGFVKAAGAPLLRRPRRDRRLPADPARTAQADGVPRGRPRAGGAAHRGRAPGAQGDHRAARCAAHRPWE